MEVVMNRAQRFCLIFGSMLTLFFSACSGEQGERKEQTSPVTKEVKTVPMLDYTLVATHPHDITSFTEGLLFHDNKLFESTGAPAYLQQARSAFGTVDMKTGKLEIKVELDKETYFGEGISIIGNKLYQLTYTNQVCFVYDAKTFARTGQLSYSNKEGWGLTTDGKHLIMSDGTYNLTFVEPGTFTPVKTLAVTESGFASDYLNELEYINGFIYANVWMKNFIVKINPATGEVVGKLDLTGIYSKARSKNINLLEMNGIAYDSISDRLLVTGKFWPEMYEIKIDL
jgi:glutaminyl-peptide cyclotransferase